MVIVNAANDIAEFLATPPGEDHARAGRPAQLRQAAGARPAPRGGRVPGGRQRRLLPAAGARPGQRRLRARARSAGAGAPARRRRAHAPLRPGSRRQSRSRRSARGRPRRAIRPVVQRLLDQIEAPAIVSNVHGDYLAANALGRALYAPVFESPEQPANSGRFTFLDPAARDFYPRLGAAGHGARGVVALAGRPQPLRPQSPGPHRRAVDPQRRVPRPLGGAQRALPPDRQQAPASPGRRRAGAQLRDADARRRRRPAPGALHRRGRLGLPAGAGPAGQLDGDAGPAERRLRGETRER